MFCLMQNKAINKLLNVLKQKEAEFKQKKKIDLKKA